MSDSLVFVTLQHRSGVKFDVRLSKYEVDRCQNDSVFASELVEKYFKLYSNNLVSNSTKEAEIVVKPPSTAKSSCSSKIDLTGDQEELLISLVSARPPLYDYRLPLRERTREKVSALWREITVELNSNVSESEIIKKWKNIRDSFLRARKNVNQKISSGSSSETKLKCDKIKKSHKYFEQLQFLEDTIAPRRTETNLPNAQYAIEETVSELFSPEFASSQSTCDTAKKRKTSSSQNLLPSDALFLDHLKEVAKDSAPMNETQHFCMYLASRLHKLPDYLKSIAIKDIINVVEKIESQKED